MGWQGDKLGVDIENDWKLDGQRDWDRVAWQEEPLSSEVRDKLILAWGLLLRSVEIKRERRLLSKWKRFYSKPKNSRFYLWTLGIIKGYCTGKLICQENKFSSIVQAQCWGILERGLRSEDPVRGLLENSGMKTWIERMGWRYKSCKKNGQHLMTE